MDNETRPADPAALVRELAPRFNASDRAGALELFHPEIRIKQPASLPHGGCHKGHSGMNTMGEVFSRYWERTIRDPRIFGDSITAVQITTQTWTAKATGRAATVDVVEVFSFADGIISEIRVFQQDTHALLRTLDED